MSNTKLVNLRETSVSLFYLFVLPVVFTLFGATRPSRYGKPAVCFSLLWANAKHCFSASLFLQNFRTSFLNVGEIGDSYIITPHGTLEIRDAIFVNEGSLVGVQFDVNGTLKMDEFPCSQGFESYIQVSTFALMRQPHNAWLWGYAFDKYGNPIANFCGTDILDGFANFIPFLERKYLKK